MKKFLKFRSKRLALVILVFGVLFCCTSLVNQASAAGPSDVLKTVTSSISNTFQKFYLWWIPGDKPGSIVINQAWLATQQLKSATITSDLVSTLLRDGQDLANIHLNLKGPAQLQSQIGSIPTGQDLQIQGSFSMQGTELAGSADVKMANQTVYFKLNQVPKLPNVDLGDITGRWYQTSTASSTATVTLSSVQQKQLGLAATKLLASVQAGTAKVATKNNQKVWVVPVTIPRSALEEYVASVLTLQSQDQLDWPAGSTNALQQLLQHHLDRIGDVIFVLWIDKSSFNPTHIETNLQEMLPQTAPQTQSEVSKSQSGLFAALAKTTQVKAFVQLDFSNFNQPIQFTTPSGAVDAVDILSHTFSQFQDLGSTSVVGTSELPKLTQYQTQQLQQLNSISPAQKQRFLDQLNKLGPLSTASGTLH